MTTANILDFPSKVKTKRKKSTPPWFAMYPDAYLRATRRLSIAARGAYTDILFLIYQHNGPIPDDNRWVACSLHITGRHWLKLKAELIACGKLVIRDGLIINPRANEELIERAEALAQKTEKRPGIGPESARNRPKVGRAKRTFPNEINGGDSTDIDIDIDIEESKPVRAAPQPPPLPQKETPKAGHGDGLAGQDGVTSTMLRDVVRWMKGGDEQSAREWLSKQVAIYGSDVVRDSYAKLHADMAAGQIIARPLQTWCSIAARMKAQRPKDPVESEEDRLDRINMGEEGYARYRALLAARQNGSAPNAS